MLKIVRLTFQLGHLATIALATIETGWLFAVVLFSLPSVCSKVGIPDDSPISQREFLQPAVIS